MTRGKLPQAHALDPQRVALLIVDMQADFMQGGRLPVRAGTSIIPAINHYIARFINAGAGVFLSRDWHEPAHRSFVTEGGRWPAHCIIDTAGAAFARGLQVPDQAVIVSKGVDPESDGYSVFENTGFGHLLTERGVRELWVAGVATEYCVRASVLDALYAGFAVTLLVDAIAGVDAHPGDGDRAIDEMLRAGASAHSWAHHGALRTA